MVLLSFKSQEHKKRVPSIIPGKSFLAFFLFKTAKKALQSKAAQLSVKTHFQKRRLEKVYPLMAAAAAALIFGSCRKEVVSQPALDSSTAAFATASTTLSVNAGATKRVVYPDNSSTRLFGTATGIGITVKWKQIAGPSTASISTPTNDTTVISGLKPGIYSFTLTVTDKYGTIKSDTANISVYQKMKWTIEGVVREALVHPSTSTSAPVIFAFHGKNGTDLGYADRFFELLWPSAVVVYPQGLREGSNTSGWQKKLGEVNTYTGVKDQDLKFFDAMYSTLTNTYSINTAQVFVHGWSSGAEFNYNVLWSARSGKFAAMANAGAVLGTISGKTAKRDLHIAGKYDPVVNFSSQQKTAQSVRNLDQCSTSGTTWATGPNGLLATHYSSSLNSPVVFLQYDGDHTYPDEAIPLMVKFFKQTASNTLH